MAKASANSVSVARTMLLKMQVRRILSHADMNTSTIEKYLSGIDRQLIDSMHIGWKVGDRYYFQVSFRIDWVAHRAFVSEGASDVAMGPGWNDGISVEVDGALQLFSEYPTMTVRSLESAHGLHSDSLSFEVLCAKLGLTPGPSVRWASGTPASDSFRIPGLPEASVRVRFVTG